MKIPKPVPMTDTDDGCVRQPFPPSATEGGLGHLVQGEGGLIEKKPIRPVQESAGQGDALLLSGRKHPSGAAAGGKPLSNWHR